MTFDGSTMTQIAISKVVSKSSFPTHQQPAPGTSSNLRNHATVHEVKLGGGDLGNPVQRKAPVNEVHSNDNQIFDNVDYQLNQEMHQEEHLDSDAETEIDDNTIPYHQYLLDTEAQNVPTEVSADTSDKVSMIAILTDLQTQLETTCLRSRLYGQRAQTVLYEADTLLHPKSPLISDSIWDSKRSGYHVELPRTRRLAFLPMKLASQAVTQIYLSLPLVHTRLTSQVKFWPSSSKSSYDQQALETDKIQLKDTITSLRIQLDGLKVEHVSLQRRYNELSKANTHSRTAYTEKLSALTTQHTKLQAQVTGSKYIPPPKRANWVKTTPLPKKKQTKRITHQPKKEWKPIKNVGKPIKRVWKPISKPVANSKLQRSPTGQFCDGGLEVAFRQHSCHIRNYDMVDLLNGSRTTNLYSISLNDMMLASPFACLQSLFTTKSNGYGIVG
ncbi:hypothetical protein Tco_1094196 [Tanacetum coccineum]|uniref:Uncharacterized protein n=1 Tax=Tanacetum coccineum TaxID=301880 RepID=A0ABQ5IHC2_9ASTR